jgi:hypothetical protein
MERGERIEWQQSLPGAASTEAGPLAGVQSAGKAQWLVETETAEAGAAGTAGAPEHDAPEHGNGWSDRGPAGPAFGMA